MKNENLIQEVYSELVDLGWPNNLEKQVNFGELDHSDNTYVGVFTNAILTSLESNSKIPSKYFGIDDSNNQGELGEPGNVGIPSTSIQQMIGRASRKQTEGANRIINIIEEKIKGLENNE